MPAESAALVREGVDAYRRGDGPTAAERMSRFIAAHPSAQEAAEAHYVRGLARATAGDAVGAGDDFARAAALTRRADLAAKAHLAAGLVAEKAGDEAAARAGYLRALELVPRGADGQDEALYRLACLLQRQGEWLEADRYFDRLVFLFSPGRLAAAASRRIRGTAWTIETGAFASRWEAEDRAAGLTRSDPPPRVRPVVRETLLWAVWVGAYPTYIDAAADLAAVRAEAPGAFVTVERE